MADNYDFTLSAAFDINMSQAISQALKGVEDVQKVVDKNQIYLKWRSDNKSVINVLKELGSYDPSEFLKDIRFSLDKKSLDSGMKILEDVIKDRGKYTAQEISTLISGAIQEGLSNVKGEDGLKHIVRSITNEHFDRLTDKRIIAAIDKSKENLKSAASPKNSSDLAALMDTATQLEQNVILWKRYREAVESAYEGAKAAAQKAVDTKQIKPQEFDSHLQSLLRENGRYASAESLTGAKDYGGILAAIDKQIKTAKSTLSSYYSELGNAINSMSDVGLNEMYGRAEETLNALLGKMKSFMSELLSVMELTESNIGRSTNDIVNQFGQLNAVFDNIQKNGTKSLETLQSELKELSKEVRDIFYGDADGNLKFSSEQIAKIQQFMRQGYSLKSMGKSLGSDDAERLYSEIASDKDALKALNLNGLDFEKIRSVDEINRRMLSLGMSFINTGGNISDFITLLQNSGQAMGQVGAAAEGAEKLITEFLDQYNKFQNADFKLSKNPEDTKALDEKRQSLLSLIDLYGQLDNTALSKVASEMGFEEGKAGLNSLESEIKDIINANEELVKSTENVKQATTGTGTGTGVGGNLDPAQFGRLIEILGQVNIEISGIAKTLGTIDEGSDIPNILTQINELKKGISPTVEEIRNLAEAVKGVDFGKISAGDVAGAESVVGALKEEAKTTEEVVEAQKELKAVKAETNQNGLLTGNATAVANQAREGLTEVKEESEHLLTIYRGVNQAASQFATINSKPGTFFTFNKDLAKQYAGANGELLDAVADLKEALRINGRGSEWHSIEYLGNGADEASQKIILLSQRIRALQKELYSEYWKELGDIGISYSEFNRTSQSTGEIFTSNELAYMYKNDQYDSIIPLIEQENALETIHNEKVKQLVMELYEAEKAYQKISDAQDNMYGRHSTDDFAELGKKNGYKAIVFENIKDSFDQVNSVSDVGVILDNAIVKQDRFTVSVNESAEAQEKLNKAKSEQPNQNNLLSGTTEAVQSQDNLQNELIETGEQGKTAGEKIAEGMEKAKAEATKGTKTDIVGTIDQLQELLTVLQDIHTLLETDSNKGFMGLTPESIESIMSSFDKLNGTLTEMKGLIGELKNGIPSVGQTAEKYQKGAPQPTTPGSAKQNQFKKKVTDDDSISKNEVDAADRAKKVETSLNDYIQLYNNMITEVTEFYDSKDKLVRAQIKRVEDLNGQRTVTTTSVKYDPKEKEAFRSDIIQYKYGDKFISAEDKEALKEQISLVDEVTKAYETYQKVYKEQSVLLNKGKEHEATGMFTEVIDKEATYNEALKRLQEYDAKHNTDLVSTFEGVRKGIEEATEASIRYNQNREEGKELDRQAAAEAREASKPKKTEPKDVLNTDNLTQSKNELKDFTDRLEKAGLLTDDVKAKLKPLQEDINKVGTNKELSDFNAKLNSLKKNSDFGKTLSIIDDVQGEKLENFFSKIKSVTNGKESGFAGIRTFVDSYGELFNKLDKETGNVVEGLIAKNERLRESFNQVAQASMGDYTQKLDTNIQQYEQLASETANGNIQVGNLEGFISKLNEYKAAVAEVKKYNLADIFTMGEAEREQFIKGLTEAKAKVGELGKDLDKGFKLARETAQSNLDNKVADWLLKNTAAGSELRSQMEAIAEQLKKPLSVEQLRALGAEFNRIDTAAKRTGQTGLSFFDQWKKSASGLMRYLSTYVSFYRIIGEFRQGIEIVKELNTEFTEMQKVSDASVTKLRKLADASFDLGASIGATAKEIQSSTADFMRLGYDPDIATQLARDANIYANVGDMGIDEATEHMISSIKAFNGEFGSDVEASKSIIDKYNEIGKFIALLYGDI